MDEKDKKAKQKKDEAAVQAELEQQLRDLGVGVNELKDTVNDAFRHGFEGRGDELGRRGGRGRRRGGARRGRGARGGGRRPRQQADGGAAGSAGRPQSGRGRATGGCRRLRRGPPVGGYVRPLRWSARKRFRVWLA